MGHSDAMSDNPYANEEGRQLSLQKSVEARSARAALRAQVRAGEVALADLRGRVDDPVVGRMRIHDALTAVNGIGHLRANKIETQVGVTATKRLRGLGPRQWDTLLQLVG
ncbi:MAG: integration host factor [Gemmatimonadetes bacterium]|nr:integration host factor [Gemmatimonadota bacterium]